MIDAEEGISGAACRLPELDAILIARQEAEGRRNFNLAHELFHILTWEAMPPEHVEEARDTGGNRVEQLANSFAAAVLMPEAVLKGRENWSNQEGEELIGRLNEVADELHVASSALRWRLASLGYLKQRVARSLPEHALLNNGRKVAHGEAPALFSKPFAEVLELAVDKGLISMRRAASLVNMTVDDLAGLLAAHGIDTPVEL